jgi:hypothetical protein
MLKKNGKHPTPEPLKMTRLIGNKPKQNTNNHVHSNSNSIDCDDFCDELCCGGGMVDKGLLCFICDDGCCGD